MNLGICSCKTSHEKRREICCGKSGHFRASFREKQGEAKFHLKSHGIFHGIFHARFQEKISRQHFCTTCRDEKVPEKSWRPGRVSRSAKKAKVLPGGGAVILVSLCPGQESVVQTLVCGSATPSSHRCKGLFPDSCPRGSEEFSHYFRSEKLQNESSPSFLNFSRILPRSLLRIFPEI